MIKKFHTQAIWILKKFFYIHAIINLIENIQEIVDDKQIGCGAFEDLEKAFDTVDGTLLLKKLSYYGIRSIASRWYKSYLSNCAQYFSINDLNLNHSRV